MQKTTAYQGIVLAFVLVLALCLNTGAQVSRVARDYATPAEAAQALAVAVKEGNLRELRLILGQGADDMLESGDIEADKADRAAFLAAYEARNTLVRYEDDNDKLYYLLEIGREGWPFPVPLAKADNGRWYFDGAAGHNELLNRAVGRNEMSAVQVCLAYVDAQREYYRLNPENASEPRYASSIASHAGRRDGLHWPSAPGDVPSPFGPLAAAAEDGGPENAVQAGGDYHGYRYRVLSGQGKHAEGGARSYVQSGNMTGGFALLAYPAVYGVTGVMTFMVNQDGTVYEKNLGEKTAETAGKIAVFDPDPSWSPIDGV